MMALCMLFVLTVASSTVACVGVLSSGALPGRVLGGWVEGYDLVLLPDSPLLGLYLTVCLPLLHCVRYTNRV